MSDESLRACYIIAQAWLRTYQEHRRANAFAARSDELPFAVLLPHFDDEFDDRERICEEELGAGSAGWTGVSDVTVNGERVDCVCFADEELARRFVGRFTSTDA